MATDKKLEQYLTQLDKSLGQIAVSDRADIVTEIRSHVLEAKERESDKSIESILSSIGEPEAVANRFLLERGLKPGKASKTPMVKWLTIGFLGTLGIAALFVVFLIYKATPLIKVNEQEGKVQLLGGMIDIADSDLRTEKVSASREIDLKKIKKLSVAFANGKFAFTHTTGNLLKWECKASANSEFPKHGPDSIQFDLNDASCEIAYPRGLALDIQGGNAKITMQELTSPVNVKVTNGKVAFIPQAGAHYKYDLKVNHGRMDTFESSNSADASLIKMELVNGSLSKE